MATLTAPADAAENDKCLWSEIFYDAKNYYGKNSGHGVSSAAIVTVAVGLWLGGTIIATRLKSNGSYRNMVNYTLAIVLRRSMPSLARFFPIFKWIYNLDENSYTSCEAFAFWETVLAVYEMESLTIVCVERYVQAKYMANGWRINPMFYCLYIGICVFFSILYAYPPLIGYGAYAKDFDCTHCTYDNVLPEGWQRYLVVTVFLMRSVKPVMVMIVMLYKAMYLEWTVVKNAVQIDVTKGVAAMAFMTMLFSLPMGLIRGAVIISQLRNNVIAVNFSIYYVVCARFLHLFGPAVGMIALICFDSLLRLYMISFVIGAEVVETDEQIEAMQYNASPRADRQEKRD